MEKVKILWVDDEIELLKPHILFLERKGYVLSTANNGEDALDMIDNEVYDIIFSFSGMVTHIWYWRSSILDNAYWYFGY